MYRGFMHVSRKPRTDFRVRVGVLYERSHTYASSCIQSASRVPENCLIPALAKVHLCFWRKGWVHCRLGRGIVQCKKLGCVEDIRDFDLACTWSPEICDAATPELLVVLDTLDIAFAI